MLLNRERAENTMERYGLKALVATSPSNVFYTSDLCSYANCFALFPFEKSVEPALIASISDPTSVTLMSPPWIRDVRYYGEFYTETRWADPPLTNEEAKLIEAQHSWESSRHRNPIPVLLALLGERGITKGRIGVDESNLPLQSPFWREIQQDFPNLEAVPAQDIYNEIKTVKSKEEIRRIEQATRITERAWTNALACTRRGMSEREFEEIYHQTILSEGGRICSWRGMYGAPIAFGRRTAFADIAVPSEYQLKDGDVIRFDGGCSYMGYPCDMGRTAVLGQPSDKLRKYWNAIFRGEDSAIANAKSGVRASSLFESATGEVRKNGIPHYLRHHTGHGWGIDGYDPPMISPRDSTPLEEGMVLCFETPYYEVGWGGILHEDIVVIGRDKSRYLTTPETTLRIV
jgi:Xaa-Pro dipeptidase